MAKIKILKDIPCFKAGEIVETSEGSLGLNVTGSGLKMRCHYDYQNLIEGGWAEEVKDEFNIDEIRSRLNDLYTPDPTPDSVWSVHCDIKEAKFFTAYRIVKAVIDKMNTEVPDKVRLDNSYIDYHYGTEGFAVCTDGSRKVSLLPGICNTEIGEKVIELCRPELEVLFGVK